MTGLLTKKYHVAILDNENGGFVSKVVESLKKWYSDKIVIRTYTDSHSMFEAMSLNKSKNKPFDIAVLSPGKVAERMVLQRSNPSLKILVCKDEQTLKTETSKVML